MTDFLEIKKNVEALQIGDVLSQRVVSPDKSLTLEKDFALDEEAIKRLKKSGVKAVSVIQKVSDAKKLRSADNFTFIGVDQDEVFDHNENCLKIDSPKAAQLHEGMTKFAENILTTIADPEGMDIDLVRENIGTIINQVHTNQAAMVSLVHVRDLDNYTFMHSVNVSVLSVILGKRLGLNDKQLELLGTGSILHDVGKTLVDQYILNKPGKLSDEEFHEMKAHAERGYKILKQRGVDENISQIALLHHEKLSGRGYPLGLKAEKVPVLARIVTIVDIYDALTGDRVYKKALHPTQAFGIMEQDVGQGIDSSLYSIFKNLMGLYPVSSHVLLANGSIARVIAQNPANASRPVVEIIRDRYGLTPKERVIVNTDSSAEYVITGIHTFRGDT